MRKFLFKLFCLPKGLGWKKSSTGETFPVNEGSFSTGTEFRQPLLLRLLSSLLTGLLFFCSSPLALALSAREVMGGGGAGGKGGAANLQSAGAASASLTATHAREVLQKTDAQIASLKALQATARNLMAPAGTPNGLKVGWLEPKDGFMANGTPITTSWSGAAITSPKGANNITIRQTQQSAYLYWKNFSVGPQTTLNFDQSAGGANVGTWIAFNKIMGSVNPTQIFGSITAQGQIYILNQNGILFHNGSQVNTHALVASTLPINENLAGDALDGVTAQGIANTQVTQFLFTSLDKGNYDPNNKKNVVIQGSLGDVVVEPGASITAPVNASHTGGLVALIGPNVENEGSISTPNGQTILAAGLQVGLAPHPSSDPTLRGMDVYVGKVADQHISTHSVLSGADTTGTTGVAGNSGYISTMEGDVTMEGATVNQLGVIDSSTSVSFNGRIDLIASYNSFIDPKYRTSSRPVVYSSTGEVTIGSDSVNRILPEWSSSATITGTSLALNSVVSIQGRSILVENGGVILAPGAIATSGAFDQRGSALSSGVSIQAGAYLITSHLGKVVEADNYVPASGDFVTLEQFFFPSGTIQLDKGAEISVAGSTDVQVDSSQNFLTLQLRGAELANSPLQRSGVVRGVNITIDDRIKGTYYGQSWIGTPLGDATGFAALVERTVGQLTEQGGSISLDAGSSVLMQPGSLVDVSGGWTSYSGGKFSTTKLIYQGNLINIANATPDRVYSGIYTGVDKEVSSKWGVTKTFYSPLNPANKQYEPTYIEGASGGAIFIKSPEASLDGTFLGQTVVGTQQLRNSSGLSTLPISSSFSISLFGDQIANNSKIPFSLSSTYTIPTELSSEGGFGNLNINNSDGLITLPYGNTLNIPAFGSLNLNGLNVTIDGSIVAPSGNVSVMANAIPESLSQVNGGTPSAPILNVLVDSRSGEEVFQLGEPNGGIVSVVHSDGRITSEQISNFSIANTGVISVASGVQINTAGLLVNDRNASSGNSDPVALNGGSITLNAKSVFLHPGSQLDVSGGAFVSPYQKTSYGNGGSITISSGTDPSTQNIHSGTLLLQASLKGYGGVGGTGGSLSISAPAIQIGSSSPLARVLNLDPYFFSTGGFSTFNLTGMGIEAGTVNDFKNYVPGIDVAPGTQIHPQIAEKVLNFENGNISLGEEVIPHPYSSATSITLTATGLNIPGLLPELNQWIRGDVMLSEGTSIELDPQITTANEAASSKSGNFAVIGQTITALGSINVPGGSISLKSASKYPYSYQLTGPGSVNGNPPNALVTMYLGSHAKLLTTGEAVFVHDFTGLKPHFGTVLAGGSISLSGNIVASAGATVDASGASAFLDFTASQLGESERPNTTPLASTGVAAIRVDSSGGSISISGGEMLYTDAMLSAHSGGPTAVGGSLVISSGEAYYPSSFPLQTDITLAVRQNGGSIPTTLDLNGGSAVGDAILENTDGINQNGGHLVVSTFNNGGFNSLTLSGNINFVGPVSIQMPGSLIAASGGILRADSSVQLAASYVRLGMPFAGPLALNSPLNTTIFGTPLTPLGAPPTFGSGSVDILAKFVDVGNLSLQNIGSAQILAPNGSIRGDGIFDIAGNLTLGAAMIYPASDTRFVIASYDQGGAKGSVLLQKSGTLSGLPLSAGGILSVYASSIVQNGTLVAPFGDINFGWDGTGNSPVDQLSQTPVPVARSVVLGPGSLTTVSGVNPVKGGAITVPFGAFSGGTTWNDPSGTDITQTGIPSKGVTIDGLSVSTAHGSLIDLQGGGNITASEWISGLSGTINYLADSATSWAIIPGYSLPVAPNGYGEQSLGVGSIVKINANSLVSSGSYTLLPASFGNLPGAYLITLSSQKTLLGAAIQPDGSELITGVMMNSFNQVTPSAATTKVFELDSPQVIAKKVDYLTINAAEFFNSSGSSSSPLNGASLVLKSTQYMNLQGMVHGAASSGGVGSSIDISQSGSSIDISPDGLLGQPTMLRLSSALLDQWQFGSLLIGGIRGTTKNGLTPVTVNADNITVESGASLSGSDIILAANDSISIDSGASVSASGANSVPDQHLSVSGNGVLLRVSSDLAAGSTRDGISSQSAQEALVDQNGNSITPSLIINGGAVLRGENLILDSSAKSSIAPSSQLDASTVSLSAGTISVALNPNLTRANLDPSDSGGLFLEGGALSTLQNSTDLSLNSYSTLDFYGAGSLGSSSLSLSLQAGAIRGFDLSGGTLAIQARSILLDNMLNISVSNLGGGTSNGSLAFEAGTIFIGANTLPIERFANVILNAHGEVAGMSAGGLDIGTAGDLGNLFLNTPLITGSGGSTLTMNVSGSISIQSPKTQETVPSDIVPGLGATLHLHGSSVSIDTTLDYSSGTVTADASSGNLSIGDQGAAVIEVGGTYKSFEGAIQYTDAGSVSLSSESGNISIGQGSTLDLSASLMGGSAGKLSVNVPSGSFSINPSAKISAFGTDGGNNGIFALDVGALAKTSLIIPSLYKAGLNQSMSLRVRSGDVAVDDAILAHAFSLSVDGGGVDVQSQGKIDASGVTGGTIDIQASGSVVLEKGATLTVQADSYDAAGKGGAVFLSAGSEINGSINPNAMLDLKAGSTINLAVIAPASSIQDLGGTIHLRAPVVVDANGDATGLQIGNFSSKILGASSVELEGYMLYDITGDTVDNGDIQNSIPVIQGNIQGSQPLSSQVTADIQNFYVQNSLGGPGAAIALSTQLAAELTAANPQNPQIASIFNLAPGVEIVNQNSSVGLTLNADWDLSTLRAGQNNVPGFLTLRTPGNITFNASLSDGFAAVNGQQGSIYNAPLLPQNIALPVNFQSWSYTITAGASTDAADLRAVGADIVDKTFSTGVSLPQTGNLALGFAGNEQQADFFNGENALTANILAGFYQVIRTGTGDITISAAGDIQLWNQFASIYTAGVQVVDPTMGGKFDLPSPDFSNELNNGLGTPQQTDAFGNPLAYAPQYSYAGGNIILKAGQDIIHLTQDINGDPIYDSVRETPSNWLYRRGAVDQSTGTYYQLASGEVESTTWWVDFSNFFEGVGALGGGNVLLNASDNISNVDAAIPTNFRISGRDPSGNLVQAGSDSGVELGGGNLNVSSGNNINAGIYYTEKGDVRLTAGGSIISNATRDTQLPSWIDPQSIQSDAISYLPTTLFLGKGSINVSAASSILLGPIANVFLMPQSVNNGDTYQTYFSTFAASDSVDVKSLGGEVTLRNEISTPSVITPSSDLQLWYADFSSANNSSTIGFYQPWLRTDILAGGVRNISTLLSLEPPSMTVATFNGDINLQGNVTLSPSSKGNLELLSSGYVTGLEISGLAGSQNSRYPIWNAATVNVSDTSPGNVPNQAMPLAAVSSLVNPNDPGGYVSTTFAAAISSYFSVTGSYYGNNGTLNKKIQLNDQSLLHASDNTPIYLIAEGGTITGLTLFSPKSANIYASQDIEDVGLYIQNVASSDMSTVSAGNNITLYDPNSPARTAAVASDINQIGVPLQSGDIQINGPGTLEVLAGGNVDLGNNPGNSTDPTLNVGITSVGNSRNPALPFSGADIIVSAGVKLPTGLSSEGGLGLQNFANTVLKGPEGSTYLSELNATMTYSGDPLSGSIAAASFDSDSTQLSAEDKARLELQLFYIVLRDTGRNHNKVGAPGYGSYASGEQAIDAFFGASSSGGGDIITWSQDIATVNGGNLSLLAPGGGLTLSSISTKTTSVAPGIITEGGGNAYIYTKNDVSIGIGRIFTLKGGDIMIWSNLGNIAAGASSKTVQSAPPTQVLIDPTSGDVETDLAGLATGGGIGVLETVAGVPPGNVDLIAPTGVIDAGDAGIRSSGNLNLAATKILNADNIAASGTTVGAPPAAPPPAAPNISGASAAAAAGAANNSAAQTSANNSSADSAEEAPSIYSIEVLGYGGGDGSDDDSAKKPTTSAGSSVQPQASL